MALSCCKRFSALLYCLNCFHSFSAKIKFKKHENVCKNHDYCYIEMPKEYGNVLKYNRGKKSVKAQIVFYADTVPLFEKMDTCYNNPKKSSITKINKHIASGISLFTHYSFDVTKNKLDYCRGGDCIKNFCNDLEEQVIKIINYEKKK